MSGIEQQYKKIRVLHVGAIGNGGGITTWTLGLLRLNSPEIQFDFVEFSKNCYTEEAEKFGANVFVLPYKYPLFFRHMNQIKEIIVSGSYDVIHFHSDSPFGWMILKLAYQSQIPVRIRHSHALPAPSTLVKKIPRTILSQLDSHMTAKYATILLAASESSGRITFKKYWFHPPRMVYCGIDIATYKTEHDPQKRLELLSHYNIDKEAIVIGNISRLVSGKNHHFLIRLFNELAQKNPNYTLFLGGDGHLKTELELLIAKNRFKDRIIMPGHCVNPSLLLCNLFDVYCFPSLHEGLGLSLVEAVCGGLYGVCSDKIPTDLTSRFPTRIRALSLDDSLEEWCNAIEFGVKNKITPIQGINLIEESPFSNTNSMENLIYVYRHGLNRVP